MPTLFRDRGLRGVDDGDGSVVRGVSSVTTPVVVGGSGVGLLAGVDADPAVERSQDVSEAGVSGRLVEPGDADHAVVLPRGAAGAGLPGRSVALILVAASHALTLSQGFRGGRLASRWVALPSGVADEVAAADADLSQPNQLKSAGKIMPTDTRRPHSHNTPAICCTWRSRVTTSWYPAAPSSGTTRRSKMSTRANSRWPI